MAVDDEARARARDAPLGATLVLVGVLLFWGGASYGLTGPFYYGHYGFHGGSYAAWARGTLRHGTIYPINETGFAKPGSGSYYVHHPVLTHQLVTLTFALFGEHEWSVRLGALIPSFTALLLIALIAWRHLGPLAGGAAAVVFAMVPVNIWYESHIDQGFPSITCLLAFFWFYLRWLGSGRWRFGLAALFFEALAGNFEWSPYFAAVPIFAHVVWTGARRRGRYLGFAALHPLAVLLPLGFHAALVHHAGLVPDVLAAYHTRTASLGYHAFIDQMRRYADTLFGQALLVVMFGWLLVVAARVVRRRARNVDLVGVVFAFAVLSYMHVFQNAVVTHAYRQLYGNVWASLAVADLVATARGWGWGRLAGWWWPRFLLRLRLQSRRARRAVALGILVAVMALTAPTSWSGLHESRLHGGVPGWTSFNPDLRQTAFAIKLEAMTTPRDSLYFHNTFAWPPPHRMDWGFYYDRNVQGRVPMRSLMGLPPIQQRHTVVILHPPQLRGDELRLFGELSKRHPVWEVEDLAALDLRSDRPGQEAYKVAAVDTGRPMTFARWLEGPYPFPKLVRDPPLERALVARVTEAQALAAPPPLPPPRTLPPPRSPPPVPAPAAAKPAAPSRVSPAPAAAPGRPARGHDRTKP